MKLINVDGMAFIGPGSEWFWTALSGIVLAVTFLAIYRQLRLQSSAGAIEQATSLARDWNSELLHRSRLAALLALREGVDRSTTYQQASVEVGNYWERVGWLVRSGNIDRRLVYAYVGNSVRLWWVLLLPNAKRLRELQEDPNIYEHFEWLAGQMALMDRDAGVTVSYDDEAYLAKVIQAHIERGLSAVQLAEELRAVLVRPLAQASFMPGTTTDTAPATSREPDPRVTLAHAD
jgi:hypothetical protein